jgi:putative peptidoglycan lipid II flippase
VLATTVLYFVIGLFFFSMFMLVLKVFYSMQDTRTPMVIAAVIIALNIAVDFVYFYSFKTDVMKVASLALGNSTAYFVGAIVIWLVLWRRLGSLDGGQIMRSLAKICVASAVMGAACWGTARLVQEWVGVRSFGGQLLQVTLAILVAAVVYVAVALLLKSKEMHALRRLVGRFFRRSQDELQPHGREPVEEDSIMEEDSFFD